MFGAQVFAKKRAGSSPTEAPVLGPPCLALKKRHFKGKPLNEKTQPFVVTVDDSLLFVSSLLLSFPLPHHDQRYDVHPRS